MCDPSLQIEFVLISSETRKKFMKDNHRNIYEEAAHLVSGLVSPMTDQDGKRTCLVYLCKSCGTNVAPDVTKSNKKSRMRMIEHLALVHTAEYQTFADQLEVTPGPKLNELLFEGLARGLIHDARS